MIVWFVFIMVTICNIFLQYKIHFTGDVYASWRDVYIRPFSIMDIPVVLIITAAVFLAALIWKKYIYPCAVKYFAQLYFAGRQGSLSGKVIYVFIFVVWGIFFLAFYPGTVMNDTIYILEEPFKAGYQHPILYNMYVYGFYKLGCFIGNPNTGLAMLAVFQMVMMDLVLTCAVLTAYRHGFPCILCKGLTLYFAAAPLFFTYAFTAVKDTPFSIVLFWLLLLLVEVVDSGGACLARRGFLQRYFLNIFLLISCRNNGWVVAVGVSLVLLFGFGKRAKWLVGGAILVIIIQSMICRGLLPKERVPSFQEKVGIPLQQVAAAVVKGESLTQQEEEYLYRLLPQDKWQDYAPCCVDVIKGDEEFDREYFETSRWHFIALWCELGLKNPRIYVEAYLLETYGVWGLETRNSTQYYIKDIYENDLGLEQTSILPESIQNILYKYYCNRFTLRYLSMGTAVWLLLAISLWLIHRREYAKLIVVSPLWLLIASLMLAVPIAFAFRYGFIFAMAVPFYIFIPFLKEGDFHEQQEHTTIHHYSGI